MSHCSASRSSSRNPRFWDNGHIVSSAGMHRRLLCPSTNVNLEPLGYSMYILKQI